MKKEMSVERYVQKKRVRSMLSVDFRRMFKMPLVYIMTGICLVMPILILIMTTMMDGSVSVDPNTGVETTMEAFTNTWQIIGQLSSDSSAMSVSMTGMCNINIVYFLIAVLVGIFVGDDFRSGYVKNLFTVRPDKTDYVISKTVVGFVGGVIMVAAFFIDAMLGGAIAGLPFDMGSAGVFGIVMCMLSKLLFVGVLVPIFLLMSVIGKQKMWMSILLSLCVGMLLFTMIPMMTPLDATIMNVALCLAGSVMFGVCLGAVSKKVLGSTSLV